MSMEKKGKILIGISVAVAIVVVAAGFASLAAKYAELEETVKDTKKTTEDNKKLLEEITEIVGAPPPPPTDYKNPVSVASVNKHLAEAGEELSFSGVGSSDNVGVTEWIWNFGDGVTATGTNVTHAYSYPGYYIVVLEVKDAVGNSDLNEENFVRVQIVHPTIPKANDSIPYCLFGVSPTDTAYPPQTISFDAATCWAWTWSAAEEEEEEGKFIRDFEAITSFEWDFGDDTTGIGNKINHTYTVSGDYPVTLTVTAKNGMEASYTHVVYVLKEVVPAEKVKYPDTYTMVSIGEPHILDPSRCYETAGATLLMHVIEPLIYYKRESCSVFEPRLATKVPTVENGLISENRLNYTFPIREGVKFHDGSELTPEDVEYSLERLLVMNSLDGPVWMLNEPIFGMGHFELSDVPGPKNISFEEIDKAITRDGWNVTIHLKEPYAPFLNVMCFEMFGILPKSWVIANGGWDGTADDAKAKFGSYDEWMNDNLIGSGAYKFVRWDRGDKWVLERFDDYWKGPAAIKYVVHKRVDEYSTRLMMLKAGDADAAYIPLPHKEDVEGVEGIDIRSGLPTLTMRAIFFNQNITTKENDYIRRGVNATFFSDINIRRGFAHAFPYDEFLEEALKGVGRLPNGAPIPKGLLGCDEEVPIPEYNPAKAKENFKKAWGGHVWENGFDFDLLYNTGNLEREMACRLVKREVTEIFKEANGTVNLNVRAIPWGLYLELLFSKKLTLFALGWLADYADPHNFAHPFMHSEGTFGGFIGYHNATVDSLIANGVATIDPEERAKIYSEIAWAAYNDVPVIWLHQAETFRVQRSWVKGWYYNPIYPGTYVYTLWKV